MTCYLFCHQLDSQSFRYLDLDPALTHENVLTELGEPPLRMAQDGSMQQRANRGKGGSKKDNKKKHKQKQKQKKKNRK